MRESRQTSNEALTEKPLRRSRSIYPGAEEVVHCCQACPLAGVAKSSQVRMPEQEVSVAPSTLALARCNTSASVLTLCLSRCCSLGRNAPKAPHLSDLLVAMRHSRACGKPETDAMGTGCPPTRA